jgi:hypothetical protein
VDRNNETKQDISSGADALQASNNGPTMRCSNNTRAPRSPAERMRAYRRRRRRGLRNIRIQIGPAEIDALIEKGYLLQTDREDAEALEFAASSFISESLTAF